LIRSGGIDGKEKKHQKTLLELAKEIMALGEDIRQIEKHMQSIWTDEIERDDLRHLKERMQNLQGSLCSLQGEIEHLEGLHCKST
jgi:SMC interacting uncharacterized protein involved in chromosome segregation